jgi:hypothetical protein
MKKLDTLWRLKHQTKQFTANRVASSRENHWLLREKVCGLDSEESLAAARNRRWFDRYGAGRHGRGNSAVPPSFPQPSAAPRRRRGRDRPTCAECVSLSLLLGNEKAILSRTVWRSGPLTWLPLPLRPGPLASGGRRAPRRTCVVVN